MFHVIGKEEKMVWEYFNQTDFQTKAIVRVKGRHCIMIKGTIQQEGITLVKYYAPNMGAPKYVGQILMVLKGETNKNTVKVGNSNTPFT